MATTSILRNQYIHFTAILCSAAIYGYLAYFVDRNQTALLLSCYGFLFLLGLLTYQYSGFSLKQLIVVGVLFRLLFLWSTPFLSQDFFRFVWDGNLVLQGVNPYSFTPDTLMQDPHFFIPEMSILHEGMGELSARHYSNYPPFNQTLFALSAWIGQGHVMASAMAMRLVILLSEIGIAWIGCMLLTAMGSKKEKILFWVLNPLVIIELTGNLHFDGVMAFGVLFAVYLLNKNQWIWSAIVLAASVHTKLIPLMLLPLFWSFLGWKKGLKYVSVVMMVVLIGFLPFYNQMLIENFTDSIGLWFKNFEFNASIFNLTQEMGRWYRGKNLIFQISSTFSIIIIIVVTCLAVFKQIKSLDKLFAIALGVCCLYLSLATTVHPWYLALPLLLSLFTAYRFMILWSLTIVLSYTAYSQPIVHEIPWVLALEYLPVFGLLVWELRRSQITSS